MGKILSDLIDAAKAAIKYGVVSLIGVAIAALVLATGYVPTGTLEMNIWTIIVLPILTYIIGVLKQYLK